MSSSASARRAARNPRLALGGYPVLLPHFTVDEQHLRYGDNFLRVTEPEEREFAARCDGRTTFKEIMAALPSAAGRASTAPYLTWLSAPLGSAGAVADASPSATWLIISPHPDDAELSFGGTLLARPEGVQVINAVCFSDLIYTQSPTAFPQSAVVNAVRRDEAVLAAAAVGMSVEFLGFPEFVYREVMCGDGDLSEAEKSTREALKVRLFQLIARHRPTAVFAPAAIGNHADHRMVFDAIIEFVDDDLFPETGFHLYEDYPYSASYQAVDDFLARFEHSYLDATAHFTDISPFVARKLAVVDIYRSQFSRSIGAHVKAAAERIAAVAAHGKAQSGAGAERYWSIGVMGAGGPAF